MFSFLLYFKILINTFKNFNTFKNNNNIFK
jgi:hypothetical protein